MGIWQSTPDFEVPEEEPAYDASSPMPDIQLVYNVKLSNCDKKTIVGIRITYPPGASTPPHRHGGCAISAYVVEGVLFNKMNKDPMEVIHEGGTWYEAPGCHHRISANPSKSKTATVVASMVLDAEDFETNGMHALMQIDPEYLPAVEAVGAEERAESRKHVHN